MAPTIRRCLSVCVLLLLLPLSPVNSQEWAPLGATWYLEAYDLYAKEFVRFSRLVSVGDTIVQGQPCKIIARDEITCLARPKIEYMYEQEGRVYYYNFDLEDFTLLVDFTAEPGETWEIHLWFFTDTIQIRVDSISWMPTETDSLRVQHVSASMDGVHFYQEGKQVIERIGFSDGLFYDISGNFPCDINFEGPLRCYEDDQIGQVKFVDFACDLVPVEQAAQEPAEVRVYPNPTDGVISLEHALLSHALTYRLVTVQGVPASAGQVIKDQIDLSGCAPGLYFLHIHHGNRRVIKKIIVL